MVRPQEGVPPRRAGRYVLGELLGRGGMAEVFAGRSIGSHGFQKPVAIKRLLPELANDRSFVDRLIEEAKLLVGMQHGNVVSVLDLAREGDDVFLVMEYVDGPSLRQLLKARGSRGLSLGAATYVVQSAAAGLEFAHARPGGAIIHADISPSNLLLTTSGEVRVADFGIARREGLGQGIVEGKWAYMAPEQARGEALTPRSDVFALGVVLYELLTGQHPFGRKVTADDRDDKTPLRVVPPRIVDASIPMGLDAICMRALAHDPRDRYARMQQLIDAIVEERFANQLREGASDLAATIRECDAASPRTVITDRPVTIVTSSLLLDKTSQVARALGLAIGTSTDQKEISDHHPGVDARGSSPINTAVSVRADGTPSPPFRPSSDELSAVIAGAPIAPRKLRKPFRTGQLALIVLGLAAVIGAIAAIAIQMSPEQVQPVHTERARTSAASVAPVALPEARQVTVEPIQAPAPVAPVVETPVEIEPDIDAPKPVAATPAPRRVAPVAPKAAVKATLRITSEPWADVVVDDGQKGETPSTKFTVKAGRHTIRLKNGETGQTIVRTVTVSEGASALVRVGADDW